MLLDTHFLLWTVLASARLREFPWLTNRQPWVVSPVSLLEVQFLAEVGRVDVQPRFFDLLREDPRFVIDEPAFDALVRAALPLSWTRDPFDRLLCAHSLVRRMPFCSADQRVRRHHPLLAAELRAARR